MANYYGFSRTNYFKVKNEKALKELVGKIPGAELWEKEGKFAFGAHGDIFTAYDAETEIETGVIDELQKIIEDNEVAILTEVGHEKLNYLIGQAYVVTKNEIREIDLIESATKIASEISSKSTNEIISDLHY